mgnify:CR=1 FL=1
MSWKIKNAEFVLSASHVDQLPRMIMPEVAVIGRSNSGKSTLINRLCGRKALARVSTTPGRTQQVNLFLVTLTNGKKERQIHLADLPGYGFATVSKSKHFELIQLIADYFREREQLQLVFLLSDIKRKANEVDLNLVKFLADCGRPVRVILTKSDKANQKEKGESQASNATVFGMSKQDLILAGSNVDTQNILNAIVEQLDPLKS